MKITTAMCILHIIKYFYDKEVENHDLLKAKNWKRISKTGSGMNIVRIFSNTITGQTMKVVSTETRILKLIEGTPTISNIKSYFKDKLTKVEFSDLPYELIEDVTNWPNVKIEDEGDDEVFEEPLDLENFEWVSISDDEFVIACGGDWQEPQTLTIKLINGKLTVTNSAEGFPDGMDEETFMRSIS